MIPSSRLLGAGEMQNKPIVPDVTAFHNGRKGYFEVAKKTDEKDLVRNGNCCRR